MLAAWKSLPELRNPDALLGWLKAITLNACRRRARRMRPVPLAVLPETDTTDQPDPALAVDVHDALSRLPERESRVLELLYLQDRPMREVAQRLETSVEATKSLAARARRRLRRGLEAVPAVFLWRRLRRSARQSLQATQTASTAAMLAAAALVGGVVPGGAPISAHDTSRPADTLGVTAVNDAADVAGDSPSDFSRRFNAPRGAIPLHVQRPLSAPSPALTADVPGPAEPAGGSTEPATNPGGNNPGGTDPGAVQPPNPDPPGGPGDPGSGGTTPGRSRRPGHAAERRPNPPPGHEHSNGPSEHSKSHRPDSPPGHGK